MLLRWKIYLWGIIMATTIYTYLHNDDLCGSRIVSMDDCMCKLYNEL